MGISDLTRWGLRLGRSPRRATRALPGGVPIGTARDNGVVLWPAPSREASSSAVVFGSSGSGKSVMVASAMVHEMCQPGGADTAYFVVDPKGDLLELILMGLAAVAPDRLSDVHFLDPFSINAVPFPFNLNLLPLGERTPLDVRALQLSNLVAVVSTGMGGRRGLGTGSRQTDVLTHVLLGALSVDLPGASPLLALDALEAPGGMERLAAITNSTRARSFLQGVSPHPELLASSASRLRMAFAVTGSIEAMLSAESCLRFDELLAPGAITLVHLGRPFGGLRTLQEFFANMLLRLAVEHLLERPSPWPGHHVRLVVDEAQLVVPVLADVAQVLLEAGRSRGISLVQMTQSSQGLRRASEDYFETVLANTKLKLIGRLPVQDAALIARGAPVSAGSEGASAVRARFATKLSNLPDRTFYHLLPGQRQRFESRVVDLDGWTEAAEHQAEAMGALRARHALGSGDAGRLRLDATPGPGDSALSVQPDDLGEPRRPRSPWG